MTKGNDKETGVTSNEGEVDHEIQDYKSPPPYNPAANFVEGLENQVEGMDDSDIKDVMKDYIDNVEPSAPEMVEDHSPKGSVKSVFTSFCNIMLQCCLDEELDFGTDDVDFAVDSVDIFSSSFKDKGLDGACGDLLDLFAEESKDNGKCISSFCQRSFSYSQSQDQSSFSYSFISVCEERGVSFGKDMQETHSNDLGIKGLNLDEMSEGLEFIGDMKDVEGKSSSFSSAPITPSAPDLGIDGKEGDGRTQ